MSHATDYIATLEKIAAQSQELIEALRAQAAQPTVAEQIATELQKTWGGVTVAFPKSDPASQAATRLVRDRMARRRQADQARSRWELSAAFLGGALVLAMSALHAGRRAALRQQPTQQSAFSECLQPHSASPRRAADGSQAKRCAR